MNDTPKKWEFPVTAWLKARLGRKLIVILLALAVLGWALSFCWVLSELREYVSSSYDRAQQSAQTAADRISSYLVGSHGDTDELSGYLEQHGIGCRITNEAKETVFEYFSPAQQQGTLSMSAVAYVEDEDGENLTVLAYVGAAQKNELIESFSHSSFWTLTAFNALLFGAAGILILLLIVQPVVNLRETMSRYLEDGTLPQKSERRDEIGRLQNTFAGLAGILQAKEQSERRLIASISHDIKTPLTAVMGYSERMLTEELPAEKQRRYIQSIHDRSIAMKSIVDAFDDYLDSGLRENAPMELMTVRDLCDLVEREYSDELEEVGATLDIDCACPQTKIICNPAQMRRYFGNLIGNSLSHGGAQKPAMRLACRSDDGKVLLEFSDNGQGVPNELLQKIFEPLYTTDRGRKVSGLGLAICHSIIRGHGGTVVAENRPAGGLCIRASLPIAHAG